MRGHGFFLIFGYNSADHGLIHHAGLAMLCQRSMFQIGSNHEEAFTTLISTITKLSQLLRKHDEELWRHLEITSKVNPQFYAFRWITLLLTQEFNFADSLHIWDTLLGDPEGPQVQSCSDLPFVLMEWHVALSPYPTSLMTIILQIGFEVVRLLAGAKKFLLILMLIFHLCFTLRFYY
ncbi:unnamed protein product [Vicia faba]|uniref:Rab-GAP TBC domain-containing protein n=1 Tax=Vicia faba TaxID=3906 RepID=A0AAV1B770_VICFA|nr:unnamed protein product [Vicia faba]